MFHISEGSLSGKKCVIIEYKSINIFVFFFCANCVARSFMYIVYLAAYLYMVRVKMTLRQEGLNK